MRDERQQFLYMLRMRSLDWLVCVAYCSNLLKFCLPSALRVAKPICMYIMYVHIMFVSTQKRSEPGGVCECLPVWNLLRIQRTATQLAETFETMLCRPKYLNLWVQARVCMYSAEPFVFRCARASHICVHLSGSSSRLASQTRGFERHRTLREMDFEVF